YLPEAIRAIVELAPFHQGDRHSPEWEIAAMDDAGAEAALGMAGIPASRDAWPAIGRFEAERSGARLAGVPVERLGHRAVADARALERTLAEEAPGQEPAVRRIVDALRRSACGLVDPRRPRAVVLIAPGGHDALERALATAVFGSETAILDLN